MEFSIGRTVLEEICAHCRESYPREAVGALMGTGQEIIKAFRATNVEEGATRFRVAPSEVLSLEILSEELGLGVLGWYHSHPEVAAVPSPTDLEGAVPGWLMVIVSVEDRKCSEIRAWNLVNGEFEAVALREQ